MPVAPDDPRPPTPRPGPLPLAPQATALEIRPHDKHDNSRAEGQQKHNGSCHSWLNEFLNPLAARRRWERWPGTYFRRIINLGGPVPEREPLRHFRVALELGRRPCVSKSEQYRRFAQECFDLARNAQDQRTWAVLLHMAQVWSSLAEERVNETNERQSAES